MVIYNLLTLLYYLNIIFIYVLSGFTLHHFNIVINISDVVPFGASEQVPPCVWHMPQEGTML